MRRNLRLNQNEVEAGEAVARAASAPVEVTTKAPKKAEKKTPSSAPECPVAYPVWLPPTTKK